MVPRYSFMRGLSAAILFTALASPVLAGEPVLLNKLGDASRCFAISESIVTKGVVNEVINWEDSPSSHCVVLRMQGDQGEFLSYMGPQQFLTNHGFVFNAGDDLNIEGVLASVDGKVMMVARSYTFGGSRFVLRNAQGTMASSR